MTRLECIKHLEEEVNLYKKELQELESGKNKHAQCPAGSHNWVDTTAGEIAWYRSAIINHEGVIAVLKADKL